MPLRRSLFCDGEEVLPVAVTLKCELERPRCSLRDERPVPAVPGRMELLLLLLPGALPAGGVIGGFPEEMFGPDPVRRCFATLRTLDLLLRGRGA